MALKKGIRLSFLAKALLFAVLLTAPMPFIAGWAKTIPLISLILGEVALIFLVILASVPKARLSEIANIGTYYLLFIGLSFALLSFVPAALNHKLFAFDGISFGIPTTVSVNLLGIIVLNIIASIAFSLELIGDEPVSKTELRPAASLYELYLQEFEQGRIGQDEELCNIERALLEGLDTRINSVICVDKDGNSLTSKFFEWKGIAEKILIESFNRQDQISRELGAGLLCQMLLRDDEHWYVVSKYRGNYLMLQAANTDASPLLETSFRVFKSCNRDLTLS